MKIRKIRRFSIKMRGFSIKIPKIGKNAEKSWILDRKYPKILLENPENPRIFEICAEKSSEFQ